ncbi:MerR family transcriptional regulator [Actinomycetospora sp. CA-101289]|uniref:MerR family transcriptional regulator n=1 Tax=Actinomycetospora sp. CA-101289 TaxID=3239893 RepID=UPI003D97DC1F
MRVAELSRRTGVSVASIKYYLREGLLPPGERTSPNQAAYGEAHVRRLRLVRALIDVGGLSVAGTRDVLAAVDADEVALHSVLGATQDALVGGAVLTDDDATERATKVLDDLVARRGWHVHESNPGRRAAVEILATSERLGTEVLVNLLDTYAETLEALARREVDAVVSRGRREDVVESAVLGTVLGAGLISALRTMAHESASAGLAGQG